MTLDAPTAPRFHGTRGKTKPPSLLRKLLHENSLGLALVVMFVACAIAQVLTGLQAYNQELHEHGQQQIALVHYLRSGHFLEALFENWESEFLQMAVFVILTIKLVQKGSSESRPLEGDVESDEDPRQHQNDESAPWPVRKGGLWLRLYEHSLSIALGLMFVASFLLHALTGLQKLNQEQLLHGEAPENLWSYLKSAQFWFESFQNWQSEFLAVFAIVMLSIFLRQRGSPQSKAVASPHHETAE